MIEMMAAINELKILIRKGHQWSKITWYWKGIKDDATRSEEFQNLLSADLQEGDLKPGELVLVFKGDRVALKAIVAKQVNQSVSVKSVVSLDLSLSASGIVHFIGGNESRFVMDESTDVADMESIHFFLPRKSVVRLSTLLNRPIVVGVDFADAIARQ